MTNSGGARTLILAWGNPGRCDDGLGPKLGTMMARLEGPELRVLSEYQLQVEHAWEMRDFDRVIFVDADRTGAAPFTFTPLTAEPGLPPYTSHELSPAAVLALANDLYAAHPLAWLVGIRGYEFDEFGEWLSPQAETNLSLAAAYLTEVVAGSISIGTAGRRDAQGDWNRNRWSQTTRKK